MSGVELEDDSDFSDDDDSGGGGGGGDAREVVDGAGAKEEARWEGDTGGSWGGGDGGGRGESKAQQQEHEEGMRYLHCFRVSLFRSLFRSQCCGTSLRLAF